MSSTIFAPNVYGLLLATNLKPFPVERTTNVFLFIGEADAMRTGSKPMLGSSYFMSFKLSILPFQNKLESKLWYHKLHVKLWDTINFLCSAKARMSKIALPKRKEQLQKFLVANDIVQTNYLSKVLQAKMKT